VPRFNAEKVAFTPDGRHVLATPGGGQNTWHVWDCATGQPAKVFRPPTVGYVWTFAVSPDGRRLLIPTHTDYVLWDLQTGRIRQRWPGANQSGRGVFCILRRWDVASGKPLYPDVSPLGHTAPVRRLFFTPDGRRLVSVGADARLWDVATSRPLRTMAVGAAETVWTLTPDGAVLVGVDEHLTVHRWSLADGGRNESRALVEARRLDIGLRAVQVRVTPDGRTLAVAAWPRLPEYRFRRYSFSFWDLETGRLRRWGADPGNDYSGQWASLSPDGRLAAAHGTLYDTLAEGRAPRPLEESPRESVFSPDGRLVAVASKDGVSVWEVATGRRLALLPEALTDGAAFSLDGRRFAWPGRDRLKVWDLGEGKTVLDREGPEALGWKGYWTTANVAFSPDGRSIATGHRDGTILLWAVPAPPAAAPPGGRETAGLVDDLGHPDPARAYAAVWRLARHPVVAARALSKRFPPPAAAAEREWAALIRDLDGEDLATREAASRRLKTLGRSVEAALRRALLGDPTAEQKRRIKALLASLEPIEVPRGEDLHGVRAVAVLEASGTVEAHKVLREWVKRSPHARLVEEAARALERLRWRRSIR
jgi:WD40 repeat protein